MPQSEFDLLLEELKTAQEVRGTPSQRRTTHVMARLPAGRGAMTNGQRSALMARATSDLEAVAKSLPAIQANLAGMVREDLRRQSDAVLAKALSACSAGRLTAIQVSQR
jgi:hypothetical protein